MIGACIGMQFSKNLMTPEYLLAFPGQEVKII